MQQDTHVTEVQFRLLNGDVLAVMPYEIEGQDTVNSYMHVGQHSPCAWDINNCTKRATPEQYSDLLKELKSLGYNVKVITRRNHDKYLAALKLAYKNSNKLCNLCLVLCV